ncbi:unnamed protein product, partial [Ectocarpus fasciculatus]
SDRRRLVRRGHRGHPLPLRQHCSHPPAGCGEQEGCARGRPRPCRARIGRPSRATLRHDPHQLGVRAAACIDGHVDASPRAKAGRQRRGTAKPRPRRGGRSSRRSWPILDETQAQKADLMAGLARTEESTTKLEEDLAMCWKYVSI